MQISEIKRTDSNDLLVTNVTVKSKPSKELFRTLKDGSQKGYVLITCDFNIVNKETGLVDNRVVTCQRTSGKSIPEINDKVSLYGRKVGDTTFWEISTSSNSDNKGAVDLFDMF